MTKLISLILAIGVTACSTDTYTYGHGDLAAANAGVAGTPVVGAAGSSSTTSAGGHDVGTAVGGFSSATGGTGADATGGTSMTTTEAGGTAAGGTTVTTGTGGAAPVAGSSSVAGAPAGIQSPAMVQLNGYAIDSTEVTRGQYDSWLATKPVPVQPAECAWNTNLVPNCQAADKNPARPVICVDWCDAKAFCSAVGKHLCGSAGDTPTPAANVNTLTDQWYNACTSGGANAYANGNVTTGIGCTVSINATEEKPVGSNLGCTSTVGGFMGIYDLSGNVQEWTNTCDPITDSCLYRGGSYASPTWSCATNAYAKRNSQYNSVGFRCCK